MGNIGRKLEEDMDKKTMHWVPGISLPPRRAFISQLPMTLGLVDYALSTKIDQMKSSYACSADQGIVFFSFLLW